MKYHALKINSEKYKWVIAFMCMLVLCIGLGFCSTAKSIFIAPITEAFCFTRSAYSVNDTLRYVMVSVVTMFFYILVQKFGTKKLMITGMVFYIISTILNAFSTTLIGFYIAGIFLGLGVSLSSTTMASLIINTWFDKHQGAVLGVVMSSNAVGSAVAVNILTPIIYKDGNPFAFRNAYLLTAILLLVTTLIFAIFYKGKEKTIHKQDTQNKKESIKDTSDGFEFKEIIKLPEFYITTLCMFFFFLTSIGNVVTPHFTDIGFEPSFVASNVLPKAGDLNGMFMDFDDVSRGYAHTEYIARVVTGGVLQAYDKVNYVDIDAIYSKQKTINAPSNRPDPKDIPEAHRMSELHKEGRANELPYKGMMLTTVVAEANRMIRLENGPDAFDMPLSAMVIGPVAIIGIRGEPFAGIGHGLKKTEGFDIVIPCCLSNGGEGYFPMQDSYDEGGYDARNSIFKAGIAEFIIEEGKKLLAEIK